MKQYVWNVLISIDQFFNTLFAGNPDETISSRLGKRQDTCGFCKAICKFLDKIDYRHCQESIEWDERSDWWRIR